MTFDLNRYRVIAEARLCMKDNPEIWRDYTEELKKTFDESKDPFLQLEVAAVAMACGLPVPDWAAEQIAAAFLQRLDSGTGIEKTLRLHGEPGKRQNTRHRRREAMYKMAALVRSGMSTDEAAEVVAGPDEIEFKCSTIIDYWNRTYRKRLAYIDDRVLRYYLNDCK